MPGRFEWQVSSHDDRDQLPVKQLQIGGHCQVLAGAGPVYVAVAAGVGPQCWESLYNSQEKPAVPLTGFGAVEGEEDTARIQEGIDTCGEEGRALIIPYGQWGVNTSLMLSTHGFVLRGEQGQLGQLVTAAVDDTYWPGPALGVAALLYIVHPDILSGAVDPILARTDSTYRVKDVSISGVHLIGPWAKGLTSMGAQGAHVHHCKFSDYHYEALWPANTDLANVGWDVSDNLFEIDNDDVDIVTFGAVLQATWIDSVCSRNVIRGGTVGIGVTGRNNTVSDNILIKQIYSGIGVGDLPESGLNITVDGNSVYIESGYRDTTGSNGIQINSSARNVTVTDNSVKMKHVNDTATINGILSYALQGSHNISGNTIELDMNSVAAGACGIRAEVGEAGTQVLMIEDNVIELRNENTTVSRIGISGISNHASAVLKAYLVDNSISGFTDTNDGFAYYVAAVAGSVTGSYGLDNVHTGGQIRVGSTDTHIGEGATAPYVNTPIRVTVSDGYLDGKSNMAAGGAPTANDGIALRYIKGKSFWKFGNELYMCVDHTYNAALWFKFSDGTIVP